ncbi:MAG: channel, inward rectifier [Gemmatimonadetes bacterium]|nr:channel, inward rectifier [Gemmatimonadota bacterium]
MSAPTIPGVIGAQAPAEAPAQSQDEPKDLGFGSVVGGVNEKRLLNRDGTFTSRREGLPFLASLSLYHWLLTMSWPKFLGLTAIGYLVINAIFAVGYVWAGPGALGGIEAAQMGGTFGKAFFFSVHTFATIGYGTVSPMGLAANVIVTLESLVGLLGFALVTGVLFSRFARPTAAIIFSERAVVAPYRGGTAFMFRVTNGRSNQLIELEAKVQFSRLQGDSRRYSQLTLERTRVVFFPMSWTIVHPIDEKSPMWQMTGDDLLRQEAEFLILLSGTDETFSQTVHARSSYRAEEIAFGHRFVSVYKPVGPDGTVRIDVRKLSDTEPAEVAEGLSGDTATWHHTGHFAGAAPSRMQAPPK